MNRRSALLTTGATLGSALFAGATIARAASAGNAVNSGLPVAFVVGPLCNLIDLAGPYEVFSDLMVSTKGVPLPAGADVYGDGADVVHAFSPYVVSDTRDPVKAAGAITVVPDFTFHNAPPPRIIVMGAQTKHSPEKIEWIREMSRNADVVMSVCTGAYLLAQTGLLDGKRATTHHDYYDDFAKSFPQVTLVRGPRYVDEGKFKTAGGLTSGIELAVYVVGQLYGESRADSLAHYLEYARTDSRPA
jgi:transcriptional regulator GlxA family with amidase domain